MICGMLSEMRTVTIVFGLAIFELQPKYLCRGEDSQDWQECLPADFCEDRTVEYKVDYSKPESIDSLFNRVHLECES